MEKLSFSIGLKNREDDTRDFQTIDFSKTQNVIELKETEGSLSFTIEIDKTGAIVEIKDEEDKLEFLAKNEKFNAQALYVKNVQIDGENNIKISFESNIENQGFKHMKIYPNEIIVTSVDGSEIKVPTSTMNIQLPENIFTLIANKQVAAKKLPTQMFDVAPMLENTSSKEFVVGNNVLQIIKTNSEPAVLYLANGAELLQFSINDAHVHFPSTEADKKGTFCVIKNKAKTNALAISHISKETLEEIVSFIEENTTEKVHQISDEQFKAQILRPAKLKTLKPTEKFAQSFTRDARTNTPQQKIAKAKTQEKIEQAEKPVSLDKIITTEEAEVNEEKETKTETKENTPANQSKEKTPTLGFGTWRMWSAKDKGEAAVTAALKAGLRHIDTAQIYETEEGVGKAIKNSGIERKEIFLATKLDPDKARDEKSAKEAIEASLKTMGVDYIDCFYIHMPKTTGKDGNEPQENDNIGIYKALESYVKAGKIKSIGLSNFTKEETQEILNNCEIKPEMFQLPVSIGFSNDEMLNFCKENNMQTVAYSPIASGYLINHEVVQNLSKKYKVDPVAVCLDYASQKTDICLFGSENPEHIQANTQTKNLLTKEDMQELDKLQDDQRMWTYENGWIKSPDGWKTPKKEEKKEEIAKDGKVETPKAKEEVKTVDLSALTTVFGIALFTLGMLSGFGGILLSILSINIGMGAYASAAKLKKVKLFPMGKTEAAKEIAKLPKAEPTKPSTPEKEKETVKQLENKGVINEDVAAKVNEQIDAYSKQIGLIPKFNTLMTNLIEEKKVILQQLKDEHNPIKYGDQIDKIYEEIIELENRKEAVLKSLEPSVAVIGEALKQIPEYNKVLARIEELEELDLSNRVAKIKQETNKKVEELKQIEAELNEMDKTGDENVKSTADYKDKAKRFESLQSEIDANDQTSTILIQSETELKRLTTQKEEIEKDYFNVDLIKSHARVIAAKVKQEFDEVKQMFTEHSQYPKVAEAKDFATAASNFEKDANDGFIL